MIGALSLRTRGVYFIMITLAFAQLLYFIGFHLADVTGGDDGLRGIPQLALGVAQAPAAAARRESTAGAPPGRPDWAP